MILDCYHPVSFLVVPSVVHVGQPNLVGGVLAVYDCV